MVIRENYGDFVKNNQKEYVIQKTKSEESHHIY